MKTSLFCLILLFTFTQTVAAMESVKPTTDITNNTSDSIHFIALPYLFAVQYNHNNQSMILRRDINQHDLSDYQWIISTTSSPEFITYHGLLHTIDTDQHTRYKLSTDLHNIIIPIQNHSTQFPLHRNNATSALWLRYSKKKNNSIWHPPSLTPKHAAQVTANERKRDQQAARLAERMADRAFYFGYDTNDDALK